MDIIEQVAMALRGDDHSMEIKKITAQLRKEGWPLSEDKILDCRELCWFKDHRNWAMPEGANIREWLPWARVEDERLEGVGDRASKCSDPKCFCHWQETK